MDIQTMDIDELGAMLEAKGLSHSEIDEWFEHAGVKGMKWGVRQQKKLDRNRRVASGTGNLRDKVRVFGSQSVISLARGGGLKGAAERKVIKMEKSKARIETGKATVRDLLNKYGADTIFNVGSIK